MEEHLFHHEAMKHRGLLCCVAFAVFAGTIGIFPGFGFKTKVRVSVVSVAMMITFSNPPWQIVRFVMEDEVITRPDRLLGPARAVPLVGIP